MNTLYQRPISTATRLAAMLLDHFIMTFVVVLFFLPSLISGFAEIYTVSHKQTGFGFMQGPVSYIAIFGFSLYFCKDIINGRSIAKRILKLQVVDNRKGQPATPFQSLIRNLFCILWPVEAIVALVNTSRRIGDRVAGTKLVHFEHPREQASSKPLQIVLALVASYGIVILLMQVWPSMETARIQYSESSYNQSESTEMERLLTDRMGEYAIPDVRIYDTIKNQDLKYLSIILSLRKNYIEDDDEFRQLHSIATGIIYSSFGKHRVTGRLKFVYQGNGQFQSRETGIGTTVTSGSGRNTQR